MSRRWVLLRRAMTSGLLVVATSLPILAQGDPNPFGGQDPIGAEAETNPFGLPDPLAERAAGPDAGDRAQGRRSGRTLRGAAEQADGLDRMSELALVEVPLSDALAYIAELAGIELHIRGPHLDDVGMPLDTPVSLSMKRVRLRTALEFILDDLDLDYYLHDGILVVTNCDEAEAHGVLRVYNVRDLLMLGRKPAAGAGKGIMGSGIMGSGMMGTGMPGMGMMPPDGMPGFGGMSGLGGGGMGLAGMGGLGVPGGGGEEDAALPGGLGGGLPGQFGGGMGGPGGIMGGGPAGMGAPGMPGAGGMDDGGMAGMGPFAGPAGGAPSRSPTDQLVDLITATIAPDTWENVGGYGSIKSMGGVLVIRQTERRQRAVADLLTELRRQLAQ